MKTFCKVLVIILIAGLLIPSNSYSYKKIKVFMPQTPEINLNDASKIAVLDFNSSNRQTTEIGRYMSDRMIEYLLMSDRGIAPVSGGFFRAPKKGTSLIDGISTRCFSIVERSRMQSILDEQNMSDMGLVDDAKAAQIGQLLGVEVMVFGDITSEYTDKPKKETRTVKKVKFTVTCTVREVTVSANIRFVDTKTGEILATRRTSKKMSDKVCGSNLSKLKDADVMAERCVDALSWEFVNMFNPWFELVSYDLDKIKNKQFKKKAEVAAKAAEKLQLTKAYAIYKELFDSDPYNPKFLYNMGILYEVTGDFDLAKEMFEGAAMLKDEKKYRKAVERIHSRVELLPFFASVDMEIQPFDFEEAASDKSILAEKIKVKGKSSDRISIFSRPNQSSEVMAKVPGEIQLEVISKDSDWVLVKLFGGKEGYIHKDNTKK